MKNTFLFIGLFGLMLFNLPQSFAQIQYGVKAGVALPTQKTSDVSIESKSFVSYYGGGFININLGRNLSVQPELQFIQLGSNLLNENDGVIKTRISYLTLPILLQYEIAAGLKLEFGPQIGLPLGGSVKQYGNKLLDWNKDLDVGLLGGLSYSIPNSNVSLDLRYYHGIVNQGPGKQQAKLYNKSLNIGAGYTFKK